MKKWLIRCLTVLAMVCLIPGDRVKSGGRNNHGALQKLWEYGDT